ncbi:MAG: ribonuclease R [bacterium]
MKKTSKNNNVNRKGKEMKQKNLVGGIRTNPRGFGFVRIEGMEEDVFIPAEKINRALNNDTVSIRIVKKDKRGYEGEVLEVLARSRKSFVGVIENSPSGLYVMPDDKKMSVPFFVPAASISPEQRKKAQDKYKALVEMTVWRPGAGMPEARLSRVLGPQGDHNTEMQSIVLESGFETSFPTTVEEEAGLIKAKSGNILEEELKNRRDFRNTWTCTIDPVDAKDFDDAISFRELSEGEITDAKIQGKRPEKLYEIGVHIADVSFFVLEGTELDKEAFKRGCSIYMVDRTVPMLPEILSNDLCSLNPGAEKMAFSAVFIMDKSANVYKRWFGRTVIHSTKRFTYETAEETIKNASAEFHPTLHLLNEMAKKMRAEKMQKGAIEFEQDEIKFKLDEAGRPIGVYKKERLDSHKLVEEFMLLANKEVAKFIWDRAKAQGINAKGIYRIHDTPDKTRIADLSEFVRSLGHTLHLNEDGDISPAELNRLLSAVENKPEANVIRIAVIRSMQKAIYSTKNIGHFGLGFTYYTHFTSPIRRYPDLIVHRILDTFLSGKKMAESVLLGLERVAAQSTEREISAAEAERSSIKYKQIEYMSDKIGNAYDGTISGVTEWGFYVEEKETRCEGMIRIKDLSDSEGEFFIFDKKSMSLIGEKSKKRLRLGDTVRFTVMGANLEKKTLDYALVK